MGKKLEEVRYFEYLVHSLLLGRFIRNQSNTSTSNS